ncbi:MAG TPA: tRNA preQ1(34) S-adenosylmethionine ribosyltransferase-isomerase QueA [Pirellulales bacterium]|nr:tRNA preQ1(34) S-adenosylmethionine ribosyltransferase-isomerase QueA [Pirellulales bacterium]
MSEIDHYDYPLPRELIAQHPLPHRADARLLVVDRRDQSITHAHVRDLGEWIRRGDAIVLNDTRVVPAKLTGLRTFTGGRWQGLFLSVDGTGGWQLLCKARGRIRPGEKVTLLDRQAREDIALILIEKQGAGVWLAKPLTDEPVWNVLDRVGRVPLPHYIRHGEPDDADLSHYQTVYAEKRGAVAAPTAGLHFTAELLARLAQQGVDQAKVTLHVGIGTFRPVQTATLSDHLMHREWGSIEAPAVARLNAARANGGRIVAVGTTSVRVLETAAASGTLQPWTGETDLFIRPPYTFRAVDALLTNFHLPRSTLLVLVRTFGGDELIRRAYEEAIREQYRFFSYGDAMLIL